MNEADVERAAAVFNALGNPTRLRTLTLVSETNRPLRIMAIAKARIGLCSTVQTRQNAQRTGGLVEVYEVDRSRVLIIKDAKQLKQIVETANKMMQSS